MRGAAAYTGCSVPSVCEPPFHASAHIHELLLVRPSFFAHRQPSISLHVCFLKLKTDHAMSDCGAISAAFTSGRGRAGNKKGRSQRATHSLIGSLVPCSLVHAWPASCPIPRILKFLAAHFSVCWWDPVRMPAGHASRHDRNEDDRWSQNAKIRTHTKCACKEFLDTCSPE